MIKNIVFDNGYVIIIIKNNFILYVLTQNTKREIHNG